MKIRWYCYVLSSTTSNKTYVGKTNNPNKRIRQHNGEIVGGAKATRVGKPWNIYLLISGFKTEVEALRFEYMMKHFKKNHGEKGRINTLNAILQSERIFEKLEDPNLVIRITNKYLDDIVKMDFVEIKELKYINKY